MSILSQNRAELSLLYIGYFNRLPDPEGLAFWEAVLNAGFPLELIAEDFSTQAEALDTFGLLTSPEPGAITAFLEVVYQNLFNRLPDGPGSTFWAAYIEGGGRVGDVVLSIIRGASEVDQGTLAAKLEVATQWCADLEADDSFVFSQLAVLASRNALDQAGSDEELQAEALDDAALFFEDAPALTYTPLRSSFSEAADTSAPVKIGDLAVFEALETTSQVTITGPDAAFFEIVDGEVFLRAGVSLDFETAPILNATIEVDDPLFGQTPDDDALLRITVQDVNEAPPPVPPAPADPIAPVAFDIDLGTVADVNALLTVSDVNLIDSFGTDADSNLDADDITLLTATIEGAEVSLADIGFTLTPGIGDAGSFSIDTSAIAYDTLALGDTAEVVITFQISDGALTDMGTFAFAVESMTNGLGGAFDLDDAGASTNTIDFLGNIPASQTLMANATAAAGEYAQSTAVGGGVTFAVFFDQMSPVPDGLVTGTSALPSPTGAIALDFAMLPGASELDVAALDGISIATTLAVDDATASSSVTGDGVAAAVALTLGEATSTASGQSLAVAKAETEGDATAEAGDMSVARAEAASQSTSVANADDHATASATVANSSTASAGAQDDASATATADGGSVAAAMSAGTSAATALATVGSVATANATDMSTAMSETTNFSASSATANVNSESTATSDDGAAASAIANDMANATATAESASTATAEATDMAQASATAAQNSVSDAEAVTGGISDAVAVNMAEASAVATTGADATAFAEDMSSADATAANDGSATASADINSEATSAADNDSTSLASASQTGTATAVADNSSISFADAQNNAISTAAADGGSSASATAADMSDAGALAQNGSVADSLATTTSSATSNADNASLASASADDNSTSVATSDDGSSSGAFSGDSSAANANTLNSSISNAVALTGSVATANASDTSDATSFANGLSVAEAAADDTSSASAGAENAANATATSTLSATTTAKADDTGEASATASDNSVAGAEAMTGGIANADADGGSAASATASVDADSTATAATGSAAMATATTDGSAVADASNLERVVVDSNAAGAETRSETQGPGVPDDLIADITMAITICKAQIADQAMNGITEYTSSFLAVTALLDELSESDGTLETLQIQTNRLLEDAEGVRADRLAQPSGEAAKAYLESLAVLASSEATGSARSMPDAEDKETGTLPSLPSGQSSTTDDLFDWG